MTQRELDQAIATQTGESLCEIRRLGFSIADPFDHDFDPEPDDLPPQVIDWDDVEVYRAMDTLKRSLGRRMAA
ncbi:Hypothetical protein PBC10988_3610 [Planctomycetales bacterium 10988]|nr:Hypothetical protein PBC10988_3610 [Planctomycetales bacterium 10988]